MKCEFTELIHPLLKALHWKGDERATAEAFPATECTLDITDFRSVMARLGYTTYLHTINAADTAVSLPLIHITESGMPHLIDSQEKITGFAGST